MLCSSIVSYNEALLKKSDSRLHNEVAFPFANPLLSMVLALPFHQWLQFSLIHLVCQAINTNNVPSMIQKRNVERERVRPEKKQKQRTHKPEKKKKKRQIETGHSQTSIVSVRLFLFLFFPTGNLWRVEQWWRRERERESRRQMFLGL